MEVRGRNGKWFGTGNGRTVRVGWVDIVCKFCPRICGGWRGMDAFVIVDVIEHRAQVGHHEHVRSEDGSGNRGAPVDGKEGADSGELMSHFFFLNVEETSNVLNHLFMGEGHLVAGGAVWRRRGDDVGGVASTVGRRGRTRWDENGGR